MYQKIGYLAEQLRLFYISDRTDHKFPYHYHDFDKITLFFQHSPNFIFTKYKMYWILVYSAKTELILK